MPTDLASASRVLVTGAGGHLGQLVATRLAAQGHTLRLEPEVRFRPHSAERGAP